MQNTDHSPADSATKFEHNNGSRDDQVRRVQTADSVWLPRDVFEKLYLNPEREVPGDLRKKVMLWSQCEQAHQN